AQRIGDVSASCRLLGELASHHTMPYPREYVEGDLAAALILIGEYDRSRRLLEPLSRSAITAKTCLGARANLMILAVRTGDRELFRAMIRRIDTTKLTAESYVNYLIETAKGFQKFGEKEQSVQHLHEALFLAKQYGFQRSTLEVHETLTGN